MPTATAPTPHLAADERGLILAAADPADALSRLVYADWLDDHDRPAEALYLRLAAAVLDPTPISYRNELRAALAEQARLVPPAWRTAFDPGVRLMSYLPYGTAAHGAYRSRKQGAWLAYLHFADWVPVVRRHELPVYLYFVSVSAGRLYVASRMRVTERLTPAETRRRFPGVRVPEGGWGDVIVGAEGVSAHFGRRLPTEAARRIEFFTRSGKRLRARLDADGRVTNTGQLTGEKRLAPASAFWLDAMLNGWLGGA